MTMTNMIDVVTKEEWVGRCYNAEERLAKASARIAELEAQAIGFRESIRKAALDSEHGHEILNLCWDSYFTEMPVNGGNSITSANDKGE
jgi:hypothetical protein